MARRGCLAGAAVAALLFVAAAVFAAGWWGSAELEKDRSFIVPSGLPLVIG